MTDDLLALAKAERELLERLTYLIQFYVYAEAEEKDVQDVIDSLSERDSWTSSGGWVVVKEDEYDELLDFRARSTEHNEDNQHGR